MLNLVRCYDLLAGQLVGYEVFQVTEGRQIQVGLLPQVEEALLGIKQASEVFGLELMGLGCRIKGLFLINDVLVHQQQERLEIEVVAREAMVEDAVVAVVILEAAVKLQTQQQLIIGRQDGQLSDLI